MKKEFREQLERMVEKSYRTLKAAKDLLSNDDFESASSRAYYSVFYVLEALLLTKGLSFSKHSGVISAFSKHFVKEGIFSAEIAKRIKTLRKDRELGDYNYISIIKEDDAKKDVSNAEEIIKEIEKYLRQFIEDEKKGTQK